MNWIEVVGILALLLVLGAVLGALIWTEPSRDRSHTKSGSPKQIQASEQ